MSIIAEDLGVVPPFVKASLERIGVPGCKVLRWERHRDRPGHPFIDPAAYPARSVAMTGTHDTTTAMEWWTTAPEDERRALLTLLLPDGSALPDPGTPWSDALRDALLAAACRACIRRTVPADPTCSAGPIASTCPARSAITTGHGDCRGRSIGSQCTTPSSGTPRRTRCRARSICSSAKSGARTRRARRDWPTTSRAKAGGSTTSRSTPRSSPPQASAIGTTGRRTCATAIRTRWTRRAGTWRARSCGSRIPPMDRGNAVAARQDGGARGRRHDLRRLPVHGLRRGPGRVGAARGSRCSTSRSACRPTPSARPARTGAMPTYRWDRIRPTGFAWMRARVRRFAALYDGCRVDHLVGLYRTYGRPLAGSPSSTRPRSRCKSRRAKRSSASFSRAACPSSRRISACAAVREGVARTDRRAWLQGAALGAALGSTGHPFMIPRRIRHGRWR